MIVVKKGPKVKVVSQVMEWQGKLVLDIRTYVIAAKGPNKGEWIPTGKGVQIPADEALAFSRRVAKDTAAALAEAEARPTKKARKPIAKEVDVSPTIKKVKPKAKTARSTEGFLI